MMRLKETKETDVDNVSDLFPRSLLTSLFSPFSPEALGLLFLRGHVVYLKDRKTCKSEGF